VEIHLQQLLLKDKMEVLELQQLLQQEAVVVELEEVVELEQEILVLLMLLEETVVREFLPIFHLVLYLMLVVVAEALDIQVDPEQ
tara:strand:+ start:234 stop:488 length:255 start_codon:yes stop_codon:yes gene_type:complete